MRIFIRFLANMAGIWLATRLVPGIYMAPGETATETWLGLALVAVVFTLVNGIVRPIIKVLTFPLYVLTFGLFSLVTNAMILSLVSAFSSNLPTPLLVDGFWSALVGGTLTAMVASFVVGILGPGRR